MVTEEQKRLARARAPSLVRLFRDGLVSLLTGRAQEEQALPVLGRLKELLEAIGEDTGGILDEACQAAGVAQPGREA